MLSLMFTTLSSFQTSSAVRTAALGPLTEEPQNSMDDLPQESTSVETVNCLPLVFQVIPVFVSPILTSWMLVILYNKL